VYQKKYVAILILAFLIAAFAPYWYNSTAGKLGHMPEVEKPEGQCVEDAKWMAANHMLLLQQWRTEAIRHGSEGGRIYHSFTTGKDYYASINTCWECHKNKEEFCDKCHDYIGIKPECWDCHYTPSTKIPKYSGIEELKTKYS